MSNLNLPYNPTLKDSQQYVDELCKERGFDKETLTEAFVLFTEEVGEMARIVRKTSGVKTDATAKGLNAADELADLLIYILHMANILEVDLEEAFRQKEDKNKQRRWI